MLRKRYVTQKTFRLDSQISEDLETLSEILERTQNDLVNVAIEKLLEDNKLWIAENIFVDYASGYLYNGDEETEFELCNINVSIKYDENSKSIHFKVIHKDENGNIIETIDETYEDDVTVAEKIKETLRFYGKIIDKDSEEVKQYLKEKLNYK